MNQQVINRESIKQRLKDMGNWIDYDIDNTVNTMYSVRTYVRKYIKNKPINDRLLVNNIIISVNIFGIELSHTIYNMICESDEIKIINSIYYFMKYKNCEPKDAYFIELLAHNCDIYTKGKINLNQKV